MLDMRANSSEVRAKTLGETVLRRKTAMTCVVGLEEHGRIYVGADSAGVSGTNLCVRADPKVFQTGPFLIGFTTSFRMGQLLQYRLSPLVQPPGMEADEFMTTIFIDSVRRTLKEGGYARRKEEQEFAGAFLVGYRDRLYCVDSDYQVGRAIDGYTAIGCGAQLALGAIHALNTINAISDCQTCVQSSIREQSLLPPEERIRIALQAAERWNAAVRAPFIVLAL
jgi:ATP-dependent protease HslVU (ClpYQ) peptidase subunit